MSKELESFKKTIDNLIRSGDMIHQEEKLEEEIEKPQKEEKFYVEDPKYVIDD